MEKPTATKMNEETSVIKSVGRPLEQATPEDCKKCHNAKIGTIIINGLCLDCFLAQYPDNA